MTAAGLRGLRVLVTRPAPQAENLCRLIEQAGGQALRLPLQAIEPAGDRSAAAARLAAAAAWEAWIFTSANAVRAAAAVYAGPRPARLAAVGAATASLLRAGGAEAVIAPEDSDGAAGLLAHPAFAAVRGQRILIVTGDSSLPLLAEELARRGAQVESAALYRRVPVVHEPAAVAKLIGAAELAVVSSGEALQRLVELAQGPARQRLLALQLAVPSARVVEKARELGFKRPALLPTRVSDAAYVELLQRWLSSPTSS